MGKISDPTQAVHSFRKPLSFAFSPAKAVYLLALTWQTSLACSHSTQRQVPCQRLLVPKAPTLSQQLRTCENQVNALSSKTLSPPLPCCLKPPYIPCLVLKYLLTLEANLLVYHVPCYNCAIAPLPGKETTQQFVLRLLRIQTEIPLLHLGPKVPLPPPQFGCTGPWQ